MFARKTLHAAALSLAAFTPAAADHWRATADPQVLQALSDLASFYGQYCQTGAQVACDAYQGLQQAGTALLNASYDCKVEGDQQACGEYQTGYDNLATAYQKAQQLMAGGGTQPSGGGVNPLGETHQDRMRAIQQWGQDRTQWGQQQMRQADQNHQNFLNSIRQ